jgi:hypothetical protein
MVSKQFAKGLKRSALTVALGLCFASGVEAQSSVGSIFGDTTANATVRVENVDTGSSREITADSSGHFTLPQLSPGRYRVTSGGTTREVRVSVGTGTPVNFAAAELTTVTVIGAGAINPIDVSSVESTTVFTAEQIQALPVQRDVTNVALLAPGTVRGDTGLGNLASFGGASVAENGYYINGFDVTNLRSLLTYANLPFESVGEQQVKTGGYGAEYGRSLGGVINLVTKRGTNDWKFGGSVYWQPNQLRSTGKDVADVNPLNAGNLLAFRSADEQDSLEYNVYGGGPIIKDKLFMFGIVNGRKNTNDDFDASSSEHESNTSPQALLKLDWNITDNHLLEFTGLYNRQTLKRDHYDNLTSFSRTHDQFAYDYEQKSGGTMWIGKYTGYLTDNFTLSGQYGDLKYDNPYVPGGLPGEDCPTVYDGRTGFDYLGCWPAATFASVRPANAGPDVDRRQAWRIDADWRLGDHAIRAGMDSEKFTSTFVASTFAGGVYYRYFAPSATGTVNGAPHTGEYVRVRNIFSSSGGYETKNEAAYLEDSWHIFDDLVLYGGIRLERFDNKNADGVSFVKSDDLWAPRLGFSWDVNGDSSFKVFGNAGRYFIPVANNTSIRASGAEETDTRFFTFTAIDPVTGAPTLGTQLGPTSVNGSSAAPNPATVAASNLSPMYQDEYILGMQKQLTENWTLGVRGIRREIKSGFDDTCAHQPLLDWATDNGFTNFDPDTAASCYLINPGQDADLALDLQGDGNFTTVTIPAAYFGLPQYRRTYHAVEVFFERTKAEGWSLQGSYTFAKSKGNAEGYVNSTLEQADAGITQDFDFAAFGEGADGYLPNDRRHTLKLFGTYDIAQDWRVGMNMLVQSGRPVNCNGFIPNDHPSFNSIDGSSIGAYSASSFWCHDDNGVPHLGNRGDQGRTPWTKTFDASLAWTPKFGDGELVVQMDVFNLLNSNTVTEYSETGDMARAAPVRDPNFLQPFNYQSPRSVRFSVRYDF